ncbi:hypothetical protein DPMN_008160 [Dreissena polymorpha]|uniref:Uncharacterized protein n=1 Tax=Dreissena polymorpha TaxID=45954 RepID=A0A9D4MZU6_DREPO|nr:hypothetical protein DPMN_008160 [Dreissena polymorpha]
MEGMLKKYAKRFLREEHSDKYYDDKDFHVNAGRGNPGEKKFRPKRAASSKAMETVQKALKGGGEEEVSVKIFTN